VSLNLINKNLKSNKFYLQAFLSVKVKEVLKLCWKQNYPQLIQDLTELDQFASLNKVGQIQITLISEDLQLLSFLKTEIENIKEFLKSNLGDNFSSNEIEIKIKNR
jgi:hypothetical protein